MKRIKPRFEFGLNREGIRLPAVAETYYSGD